MDGWNGTAESGRPDRRGAGDGEVVVYRHVGCPYCERVVRALQDNEVRFESRFVVPRHSDRDAVARIAGTRSVPVLVDEAAGVVMAESANIVDHVESVYG
jgi:glutathione S-transferase